MITGFFKILCLRQNSLEGAKQIQIINILLSSLILRFLSQFPTKHYSEKHHKKFQIYVITPHEVILIVRQKLNFIGYGFFNNCNEFS